MLLILDVVMLNGLGVSLVLIFCKDWLDFLIIFMSGFVGDDVFDLM